MTKHVSARWTGELRIEATDAGGAVVGMSGADDTYGPAALVLAALAGCTGADVVSVMTKKRVAFDGYRVEVDGQQREDYPRLYTSITVEHIVTGSGIDDKAVTTAVELSARKYCVVGASLASGEAEIRHRMRITDESGERTADCLIVGPQGKGLSYDDRP